jgi:pyruvate dehydrogenase E1 component beta subunit
VTTLKPFDAETVLKSVARTGRVVIVQEAARTCGFAGEIAACIAEKGLFDLEAPITRVTGFDTVMPLPQLESLYMPDVARVLQASRRVLAL